MNIRIGNYELTITLTNKSVFGRIDTFLKTEKFVHAIRELREHRMSTGGDSSLKSCKEYCENRKLALGIKP